MGGAVSAEFLTTGRVLGWRVPRGVTALDCLVIGAGGQGIEAPLVVTPGELFYVYVGSPPTFDTGGWPDGGNGTTAEIGGETLSSAGSGSSQVRRGADTPEALILQAAGRGGLGFDRAPSGTGTGGSITGDGFVDVILTAQPAAGDVPRRPRGLGDPNPLPVEWDPAWWTLAHAGATGGTTRGADGYTASVANYWSDPDGSHPLDVGAGGGGFGGGSSGSVYVLNAEGIAHVDPDDPLTWLPRYLTYGPNNGGWYAAPGVAATPAAFAPVYAPGPGYAGGFVRFEWADPVATARGWRVGRLGL